MPLDEMSTVRIPALALLAAAGMSLSLAVPTGGADLAHAAPAEVDMPNIVFVLLDDFSTEIVQYMDGLQGLANQGVSFSNFITSAPLCCPSRASILTGKYPHNTGVLNNDWPNGGITGFLDEGLQDATVGVYLDQAGYRTGFMGKFLNGYRPIGGGGQESGEPVYPRKYVPPGWDEWFATGAAYQSFTYKMVAKIDDDVSNVTFKGPAESNYVTDVLADRAVDFIGRNAATGPFFLTVNTFAVHGNPAGGDPEGRRGPRFPPAPRDRPLTDTRPDGWAAPTFEGGDCGDPVDGGCDDVAFPDPSWGDSFNALPENAPFWYPDPPYKMGPKEIRELEQQHIDRVRMSQSIDDLIDDVRLALETAGVLDNTYLVVTSDNGYHLGQHAIGEGKSTPYTDDVVTPLIVVPPGGTEPSTVSRMVQNVDFLPTFLRLAHQAPPADVDGRSFGAAIDDAQLDEGLRQGALIEFNGIGERNFRDNPDTERELGYSAPKYHALRTVDYLYVDYSHLDLTLPRRAHAEYYDLATDPDEMHNLYQDLPKAVRTALNANLLDYADCAGPDDCWYE